MEVKGNYGGYSANQTSGAKAAEKSPEMIVAKSESNVESAGNNRDVVEFSSGGVFPKQNYEDYLRNRIAEVASRIPELAKQQQEERGESLTFSEWYGKSVTISEDSQKILDGVAERKAAHKAAMEALKAEQPENPFMNTGELRAQYHVFGEALFESGFYDDMSGEDIEKVQNALASMTSGISRMGSAINGGMQADISREAARLELASSVSALRLFSDKFVPEDKQDMFNDLIDKYESYNKAKVDAHMNLDDIRDGVFGSEMSKVKHTEAQKSAIADVYRQMFDRLSKNLDSAENIFDSLRDTLADYASGGSKNAELLETLRTRNDPALKNMQNYWQNLMDMELSKPEEEAAESEIAEAAETAEA